MQNFTRGNHRISVAFWPQKNHCFVLVCDDASVPNCFFIVLLLVLKASKLLFCNFDDEGRVVFNLVQTVSINIKQSIFIVYPLLCTRKFFFPSGFSFLCIYILPSNCMHSGNSLLVNTYAWNRCLDTWHRLLCIISVCSDRVHCHISIVHFVHWT